MLGVHRAWLRVPGMEWGAQSVKPAGLHALASPLSLEARGEAETREGLSKSTSAS